MVFVLMQVFSTVLEMKTDSNLESPLKTLALVSPIRVMVWVLPYPCLPMV